MSNYQLFSTRQFLLKFTNQSWWVSRHVYVSYIHRLYLYIYICIMFTKYLPQGSLMRTYLISISHKQRYFVFLVSLICIVVIVITFLSGNGLSYTGSFQKLLIVMTIMENSCQSYNQIMLPVASVSILGILGLKVLSNLLHIH